MAINLDDSTLVAQGKPLDAKEQFNDGERPYNSIAEANESIIPALRYTGLTVNINNDEYWYRYGILDEDLILKILGSEGIENLNEISVRLYSSLQEIPLQFNPSPHRHSASDINQDANNRFVTDAEISNWNAKETPSEAQEKADAAKEEAIADAANKYEPKLELSEEFYKLENKIYSNISSYPFSKVWYTGDSNIFTLPFESIKFNIVVASRMVLDERSGDYTFIPPNQVRIEHPLNNEDVIFIDFQHFIKQP